MKRSKTRFQKQQEALREKAYRSIAADLREFGYPDVTAEMIEDIHVAYTDGKPLPHGVIGIIVGQKLDEAKS